MAVLEKLQSKKIWDKSIKYFMLGYLPLGILMGIFTPDDILAQPWAHAFTNFMSSWLPYVAAVGQWTPVPATQFIAAVTNLIAIVISLSMMIFLTKYYSKERVAWGREKTKRQLILYVFYIILIITMVGIVFFIMPIGDPPGRKDRIMIGSKLGMGIYGSMLIAGGWLGLVIVYTYIITFVTFLLEQYKKTK